MTFDCAFPAPKATQSLSCLSKTQDPRAQVGPMAMVGESKNWRCALSRGPPNNGGFCEFFDELWNSEAAVSTLMSMQFDRPINIWAALIIGATKQRQKRVFYLILFNFFNVFSREEKLIFRLLIQNFDSNFIEIYGNFKCRRPVLIEC